MKQADDVRIDPAWYDKGDIVDIRIVAVHEDNSQDVLMTRRVVWPDFAGLHKFEKVTEPVRTYRVECELIEGES